jgi:hypothetical protein
MTNDDWSAEETDDPLYAEFDANKVERLCFVGRAKEKPQP